MINFLRGCHSSEDDEEAVNSKSVNLSAKPVCVIQRLSDSKPLRLEVVTPPGTCILPYLSKHEANGPRFSSPSHADVLSSRVTQLTKFSGIDLVTDPTVDVVVLPSNNLRIWLTVSSPHLTNFFISNTNPYPASPPNPLPISWPCTH